MGERRDQWNRFGRKGSDSAHELAAGLMNDTERRVLTHMARGTGQRATLACCWWFNQGEKSLGGGASLRAAAPAFARSLRLAIELDRRRQEGKQFTGRRS